MNENPYLRKKTAGAGMPPILLRVPIHDFKDNATLERELLPFEMLVARIPNTKPTGFTHHVGLIYKDGEERVYSLMFLQHHGELQDTEENLAILRATSGEAKNGKSAKKPGDKGKKSTSRPRVSPGKKRV